MDYVYVTAFDRSIYGCFYELVYRKRDIRTQKFSVDFTFEPCRVFQYNPLGSVYCMREDSLSGIPGLIRVRTWLPCFAHSIRKREASVHFVCNKQLFPNFTRLKHYPAHVERQQST